MKVFQWHNPAQILLSVKSGYYALFYDSYIVIICYSDLQVINFVTFLHNAVGDPNTGLAILKTEFPVQWSKILAFV
jgi:hypothetical protein